MLTPFDAGTLEEYILRAGHATHRMRDAHPAFNQPNADTVEGLGSADYEGPHGNN